MADDDDDLYPTISYTTDADGKRHPVYQHQFDFSTTPDGKTQAFIDHLRYEVGTPTPEPHFGAVVYSTARQRTEVYTQSGWVAATPEMIEAIRSQREREYRSWDQIAASAPLLDYEDICIWCGKHCGTVEALEAHEEECAP